MRFGQFPVTINQRLPFGFGAPAENALIAKVDKQIVGMRPEKLLDDILSRLLAGSAFEVWQLEPLQFLADARARLTRPIWLCSGEKSRQENQKRKYTNTHTSS
jgi:hypothetical protein